MPDLISVDEKSKLIQPDASRITVTGARISSRYLRNSRPRYAGACADFTASAGDGASMAWSVRAALTLRGASLRTQLIERSVHRERLRIDLQMQQRRPPAGARAL